MILEQINPDLLALAKESDTVLHDIYEKIDSICLTNSNRILSALLKTKSLTQILVISTVMETMMREEIRLKRFLQRFLVVRMH